MPGTLRNRKGNFSSIPGGTAKSLVPASLPDRVQGSHYYQYRDCWDVIGNFDGPNLFSMNKWSHPLGRTTGKVSWAYELKDWYLYAPIGPDTTGIYSDAVHATKALAGTNPSRPVLDVWVFLFELKDIPRMIKSIGNVFARRSAAHRLGKVFVPTKKDVADGYLSWTFGWDLLIKDLLKLFDYTESVDRRVDELNRLYSGRGLRRRYKSLKRTNHSSEYVSYVSTLAYTSMRIRWRVVTECEQWATITWKPTAEIPWKNSEDQRSLARSLVFGHRPDIDTIWNALPWSWLEDWFTTAGDFFTANRNQVPATHSNLCLMTKCAARGELVKYETNAYNATFAFAKGLPNYALRRTPYYGGPSISAYLPILTDKQQSILGALSITRFL